MNTYTKYLGGLFSVLLFFIAGAVSAFAQSSVHFTAQEVSDRFQAAQAAVSAGFPQFAAPEPIATAEFYATGVTIYSNNTYQLDTDTTGYWTDFALDIYFDILANTGNMDAAMQGAMGTLTPEQEYEARFGRQGMGSNGPIWLYMVSYSSLWSEFSNPGGGGGNQDND